MAWTTPITDRTEADVANKTSKGVINAADMNRIEGNVAVISALGAVSITTPVTDWDYTDYPLESDHTRIINNTTALRSALMVYDDTPDIPSSPLNTWSKFNDLEQNISDMYTILTGNIEMRFFAGEVYAGETIGVI